MSQGDRLLDLTLNKDEALVLFEFLARISSSGDWSVEDSAETRVLWNLESQLEKVLVEPLSTDYVELLRAARDKVRDPSGTDGHSEPAAGRLALWLDLKDIAFIADQWRRIPDAQDEATRDAWSRLAFRAVAALRKAGIDYEPKFPDEIRST
jgi:hypothetical protein